jgi:hypothetical protein
MTLLAARARWAPRSRRRSVKPRGREQPSRRLRDAGPAICATPQNRHACARRTDIASAQVQGWEAAPGAGDTHHTLDDTAREQAIYQALKVADEVAAARQAHLLEEHGADPERSAPQTPSPTHSSSCGRLASVWAKDCERSRPTESPSLKRSPCATSNSGKCTEPQIHPPNRKGEAWSRSQVPASALKPMSLPRLKPFLEKIGEAVRTANDPAARMRLPAHSQQSNHRT